MSQRNNRFFLEGNPEAIVIVEFAFNTPEEIDTMRGGNDQ